MSAERRAKIRESVFSLERLERVEDLIRLCVADR
jgi:hypothetical protein